MPRIRGDGLQGGLDRRREIDRVHQIRPDDQLVHVDARAGVEHRAPVGQRDQRQRIGQTLGGQPGAVHRIDGDVHQRPGAGAAVLTGVEHRRVVLLAFADDDDAAHRDGAQDRPDGVDGRPVHLVLVTAAEETGGGHCGGFGGPDQLQGENPVVIQARPAPAGAASLSSSSSKSSELIGETFLQEGGVLLLMGLGDRDGHVPRGQSIVTDSLPAHQPRASPPTAARINFHRARGSCTGCDWRDTSEAVRSRWLS